jgi:hypothetical protein
MQLNLGKNLELPLLDSVEDLDSMSTPTWGEFKIEN